MILGIGSDLVDIRRIESVIAKHGERFLARIFTETERSRAERKTTRVETYAKRFAAKEACAKALGTGLRNGVFWRDMGVVNLPSGRPTLALTGGALERLKDITPADCEARIDLTITDEGPMAQAFVIISASQRSPELVHGAGGRRLSGARRHVPWSGLERAHSSVTYEPAIGCRPSLRLQCPAATRAPWSRPLNNG